MNKITTLIIFVLAGIIGSAQECGIIYVTTNGASSGSAGTQANPADLNYGLTLVTTTDTTVWIASGTYTLSTPLNLSTDLVLEGGFNSADWTKSNGNETILHRDDSNVDMANKALVGISGNGVSGFRLQDLTITVTDAPANEISVYGIHLSNCSNYHIVRCNIQSGDAGAGIPGVTGAPGNNGQAGNNGQQGDDDNVTNTCGGAGGGGGGTGSGNGGTSPCSSANGNPGGAPTVSCAGGGGGSGGAGGRADDDGGNGGTGGGWTSNNNNVGPGGDNSGLCNDTDDCNDDISGESGSSGANGGAGSAGTAGTPGSHSGGFWTPGGQGNPGTCGIGGQGGTGGGGGAGEEFLSFCNEGTGSSGGGGGGGGEGGQGGTGGTGGGSSYSIYLHSNNSGGKIIDCNLQAGGAGTGGQGGNGGQGGTGGLGGNGIGWFNPDLGCSGSGGNGGAGGTGGQGGSGQDGQSMGIYEDPLGTSATVTGSSIPGNPPVITVLNTGSIGAPITFNAGSSGNWDFGQGATPGTGTGAGPHQVTYSSLGRKDIIFDGTKFEDYVTLIQSGAALGVSITPEEDTTICLGASLTFTATGGVSFSWTSDPAGFTSPDSSITVSPLVDTKYIVSAQGCDGTVSDSVFVAVGNPITQASIQGLDASYCENDAPVEMTGVPPGGTFAGPGVFGNFFNPKTPGPGDHLITYTIDCGIPAQVTVTIIPEPCGTGIYDIESEQFSIYPNPFQDAIEIKPNRNITDAKIRLISTLGKTVYESNTAINQNAPLKIKINDVLHPGIYLLTIEGESQNFVYKLLNF